jgi:hypothetical protein
MGKLGKCELIFGCLTVGLSWHRRHSASEPDKAGPGHSEFCFCWGGLGVGGRELGQKQESTSTPHQFFYYKETCRFLRCLSTRACRLSYGRWGREQSKGHHGGMIWGASEIGGCDSGV